MRLPPVPMPDLKPAAAEKAVGMGWKPSLREHGPLLACVLPVLAGTRGYYLADTQSYAADVARSYTGAGGGLWEFGHLFWRPLGRVFVAAAWPLLGGVTGLSPMLLTAAFFITVSLSCAVATAVLWNSLARQAAGSRALGFVVGFGLACANAFLTYAHSGTPYIPGLLCITLAVWLARRGGARTGWGAAALTALAALLWFPYVLAAPGVLFVVCWPAPVPPGGRKGPANGRLAVRFSLVLLLCLALGFGFGAAAQRIGSAAQFRQWVVDSGHGWSQNSRVLRLATGVPRTFFYMGDDGILYKRFLRKDPYAPVTAAGLIRASLWRIALFGVFVLALLWSLRRQKTRWALFALLAGALPVLTFAVLLFEPGSAERYLPAYPFLLLAAAIALRDGRGAPARAVVLVFVVVMCVNNVFSMSRWRIDRLDAASIGRALSLKAALRPGSMVATLSNQDDLGQMCNRRPFAAVNRPDPLPLYDMIEPATLRVLTWRQEFARKALATWEGGGDVWITRRVWSPAPRPAWKWAEGDDPRISWRAIPPVFAPLETDAATPGEDGFVRLTRSPHNAAELARLAALPAP